MKEIALIVHEDATLSTVTGAMDMLIHTNNLFKQTAKPLPFNIVLAGEKPVNNLLTVSSPFVSYCSFEQLKHPDLIIVPAFYGERTATLEKHRNIIKWIGKMYSQGAEVAPNVQASRGAGSCHGEGSPVSAGTRADNAVRRFCAVHATGRA